jgi:NAD-dependent SIR2 family protein deacetylase
LRQRIKEVQNTSLSHRLIKALRDGGRLMRCYTQNIDGLEGREGLETNMNRGPGTKRRFMKKIFQEPRPPQSLNTDFDGGCEVVQLHGDLEKTRCSLCHALHGWDEAATISFLGGEAPSCEQCKRKNDEREAKGKRGTSVGLLRPNIVLYGEEHPSNHLLAPFVPFDLSSNPEVLIIMGTSLKVFGLQKIVKDFAKQIHSRKDGKGKVIFVNRTKPAESVWEDVIDQYVAMDCDDWVRDLRGRREELWLRQGELNLKVAKSTTKRKRRDGESCDRATKMPKKTSQSMVWVEIPGQALSDKTQQWRVGDGGAQLLDLPLPRDVGSEAGGQLPHAVPSTPQHPRAWKQAVFEGLPPAKPSPVAPPYSPLSPRSRSFKLRPSSLVGGLRSPTTPSYPPLRRSFKPPAPGPPVPYTPSQPGYSPITPARRKREVHVYSDPDAETQETYEGVPAATSEEMVTKETPIRKIIKAPLSESGSNVRRGKNTARKVQLPATKARGWH